MNEKEIRKVDQDCERCGHGIYDPDEESWNCGAGCLTDDECMKEYVESITPP